MLLRLLSGFAAFVLAVQSVAASPEFWAREWPRTDFSRTSLSSWVEILSGGPPKDGIPALDDPTMIQVSDDRWLDDREPVITVEIDGAIPHAYPLRYLTWHEIVNDTVAGVPVAITFCPLCNSGIVFDRRTASGPLSFGVSGKLRNSDMIMYDRETESWWQQAMGEAIVGQLTGTTLRQIPTWMESWGQFHGRNPDGLVMEEPGWSRDYGSNPYVSYDSSHRPSLYSGELPPHDIPALARVVRVGDRAWPVSRLTTGVVSEEGLVLTWEAGQTSALDTQQISKGRDVGSVRVRDQAGQDVAHDVMFAFAFHAFWPDGRWMLGN
ncbi:DUF3179 domain-containing protein [Aestuariibius sp. 2305UL40-4]|uniref:DUF3179 domain-containing protein n=1 Tax=Aestuariibius violaceus TaxID=3234132 RepID=UPI00345F0591